MSDIIAFIRERLDADEEFLGDYFDPACQAKSIMAGRPHHAGGFAEDRHRRAINAKRRIVDRHDEGRRTLLWDDGDGLYDIEVCDTCMTGRSCDHCIDREERHLFAWPCPTLRDIASEWDGHSDYQREWAP